MEPKILIIIAAGRSGSKYLRDLFAASDRCAVVPYDINYVWRYGNEGNIDDVLGPGSINATQRDWIRRRVLGLAGWRASGRAQIVVEKSVPNSLRVAYVKSVFPEARFIHLVRDGRAVAESARRVWNEPPSWAYSLQKLRYLPIRNLRYLFTYARNQLRAGTGEHSAKVWGPRYPGIARDLAELPLVDVCSRQWIECVRRATFDLERLPAGDACTVRFEDVVSDWQVVDELCRFVGIDARAAVKEAWQQRSDRSNIGKWRDLLSDAESRRLTGQMAAELSRFGYLCAEQVATLHGHEEQQRPETAPVTGAAGDG